MLQTRVSFFKICVMLVMGAVLFSVQSVSAESGEQRMLIAPQKDVGKPVMEALSLRQANRNLSDQMISEQDLSNLLWAAFGVNRADGRRTVPTAHNKQNVAVYAVLKTGVWKYDGLKHSLTLIKAGDVTAKFDAPVALLYVAPQEPADVSGMHVGSMYQSVALYCASKNLSNVVKTGVRNALDGYLDLPEGEKVFIVQLVGMPGK